MQFSQLLNILGNDFKNYQLMSHVMRNYIEGFFTDIGMPVKFLPRRYNSAIVGVGEEFGSKFRVVYDGNILKELEFFNDSDAFIDVGDPIIILHPSIVPDGTPILEPQDEMNKAIMGFILDNNKPRTIYDKEMVIEGFMNSSEMSREEAIEWYEYNTIGGYYSDKDPIYVDTEW